MGWSSYSEGMTTKILTNFHLCITILILCYRFHPNSYRLFFYQFLPMYLKNLWVSLFTPYAQSVKHTSRFRIWGSLFCITYSLFGWLEVLLELFGSTRARPGRPEGANNLTPYLWLLRLEWFLSAPPVSSTRALSTLCWVAFSSSDSIVSTRFVGSFLEEVDESWWLDCVTYLSDGICLQKLPILSRRQVSHNFEKPSKISFVCSTSDKRNWLKLDEVWH